MAAMVTTAELLNPENASRGVSTPLTPSATTTNSATRSARHAIAQQQAGGNEKDEQRDEELTWHFENVGQIA